MIRKLALVAAALSLTAYPPMAHASPYGDDLTKCLVKSTNETDKIVLMRWIFSVISLNPQVSPLVAIDKDQRRKFDSGFADLVERLIYSDCHKETVLALKYEGQSALSSSFKTLGEIATQEIMKDSAVTSGMKGFVKDLDEKKLAAVFSEAGISSAR